MLPCSVKWAGKKSPLTDGLLDSGADGVVLPLGLAEFLNLDLNPANKKPMHVVGRKIERYVTKVNLILGRGRSFGHYPRCNSFHSNRRG